MTTFDDREQAFENKFAHDEETEFKAVARRNRMLGLWAAGLMGLSADHVEEYARAVVKSDFEQPGDEDVLRKVFKDLSASGTKVTEGAVRGKMDELLAIARDAVKSGNDPLRGLPARGGGGPPKVVERACLISYPSSRPANLLCA